MIKFFTCAILASTIALSSFAGGEIPARVSSQGIPPPLPRKGKIYRAYVAEPVQPAPCGFFCRCSNYGKNTWDDTVRTGSSVVDVVWQATDTVVGVVTLGTVDLRQDDVSQPSFFN